MRPEWQLYSLHNAYFISGSNNMLFGVIGRIYSEEELKSFINRRELPNIYCHFREDVNIERYLIYKRTIVNYPKKLLK